MKRRSTIFLQVVIVLIGIVALAILFWEPRMEGRNIHATLFEIYFQDPFLAYAYLATIPFFVALYQAFSLLGQIGKNKVFSPGAVRALGTIKYCAIAIIGFALGAEGYFFFVVRGTDDIAGGVAMGLMLIFAATVIATAAAVFEKLLQSAVDLKAENDLTV